LQVQVSSLLDFFFLLPHAIDGLLLLLHLIAQYLLRLCVRSLRRQGVVALQQPFYHGLFLLHGLGHSSIFLLHVRFSCLLDLFFLLHQAIDDFLLLAQLIAKCLVIGLLRMGFRSLRRQGVVALQQPCYHDLFLLHDCGQCNRFLLQVRFSCLLDFFFLLPHAIDGLLLLLHLIAQYLLRLCVRSLRRQGVVALQQPFYHGLFLLHGRGQGSIFLLQVRFSCLLDLFFLLHQAIDCLLLLAQLIAKCLVIGLLRMGFRSLRGQGVVALQQPFHHDLFLLHGRCHCNRFLLHVHLSCLLDIFFLLHQAIDCLLFLAQLFAKCLFIGLLRRGFRSLRGQGGVALQQPFYHDLFLLHGRGHCSICLLQVRFECLLDIFFLLLQAVDGLLLLRHLIAQCLFLGLLFLKHAFGHCSIFLLQVRLSCLLRQSGVALQQMCYHDLYLLHCPSHCNTFLLHLRFNSLLHTFFSPPSDDRWSVASSPPHCAMPVPRPWSIVSNLESARPSFHARGSGPGAPSSSGANDQ